MDEIEQNLFDTHDNFASGLQCESFTNVDDAKKFVQSLPGPVVVRFIYPVGTRHFVWFQSPQKVLLTKTKKKKGE
jgi:hypothetical protein